MRILFYGDSNTYGYDPADPYVQRYPLEKRWTTLLQEKMKGQCEIISEGMNGRKLPDLKYDGERIQHMLNELQEGDLFAVMLGTNDILLTIEPDADIPIGKMHSFLNWLTERRAAGDILVIAPPHIGGSLIRNPLYRRYYVESRKMNAGFKEVAKEFHANIVDTGDWGIELSADLVHLSEQGHRQFASKMAECLQLLYTGEWLS